MADLVSELEDRLLRYCAIDSQSDEDSPSAPSTAIQLDLARLLVDELQAMGAADVRLTDYGVVLATIPGTAPGPTIGLLAHMDTAPQFNATGVKPRVIRRYNGGPITLPDDPALVLSPEVSPQLAARIGHDIVTASGTTLLGADDKSGIAILMTAARQMLADRQTPRTTVRLAFTPDEEIGRGVDTRLPADIGADFAFTFDGADPGEVEWECFSADNAVITLTGVSAHPGSAKGRMVNALTLAGKLAASLPPAQSPELTEGREGFVHLYALEGTAARAELRFILRDFDTAALAARGDMLRALAQAITATEPRAAVTVDIHPEYRNMRERLEQDLRPVLLAETATRRVGLEPRRLSIRGGTDGSRLTELGLPCPNLPTGMQEIHGPLEWISLQDMEQATRLCLALVEEAAAA